MVRVGFVEWPEHLHANSPVWNSIAARIADLRPDLLITNELPFGAWIAEEPRFDPAVARESMNTHGAGVDALMALGIPAVVSSRPVWAKDRLANEAIVIEDGHVRAVHTKHYLPEEPGWYEASWYESGRGGFVPDSVLGSVIMGVMLCTDAMFNEHARQYGRAGAHLIAMPRAAGTATENWLTAGKMAAIVSGSYVVSSNRVGTTDRGTEFGGSGFAFDPAGRLISMTSSADPIQVFELDPELAVARRTDYPCYVPEQTD